MAKWNRLWLVGFVALFICSFFFHAISPTHPHPLQHRHLPSGHSEWVNLADGDGLMALDELQ